MLLIRAKFYSENVSFLLLLLPFMMKIAGEENYEIFFIVGT